MAKTLPENLREREEREFNEIDAILASLLEEGLITDIECRLIAGCNQLLEKQAAVYKVITSKTKEEAAHLTEIFRTLTLIIHAGELPKMSKTSDCKDEYDRENNLLQDKPNPLLNNTVLACLFRYLPLDDIKNSRFVCRKWNSVAEVFLRKRCIIHFCPDGLTPQIFIETSKYSLPDLPFPAYKFSEVDYARCLDLIENFFDKWGKNIKEVEFVALNRSHPIIYDITSWIVKSPNLCSLIIHADNATPLFSIPIDKLAIIKTVLLKNCRILTNGERVTFLPFSNVSLIDVSFQKAGSIIRDNFCYNDFFDFSQTVNLAISNEHQDGVKFDMEGQINKTQLYLCFVTLKNFSKAKGDVNLLKLSGCDFTERNDLKITRMVINYSTVNLSVLPQTLEKLDFGENVNIVSRESFQLPNLKYCGFDADRENSKMLSNFATVCKYAIGNCPNLTEVELSGILDVRVSGRLDLDCIPRSVKKLRIDGSMKFDFTNSNQILEIDNLILFCVEDFWNCKRILEAIKPKVLVINYFKCIDPLDPSDIVEIILANKQIGTIIVGTHEECNDLYEDFPFEGSNFSNYVDKKSNCYKFENQVGHAIECTEFKDFNAVAYEGDDYFSFNIM